MTIRVLYIALAGTAVSLAPASAQQELSLDDCIKMALDRNIGLQRQVLAVDLAKDNLRTSRVANLPALEGFFSHNLSSGKTVNYEDYTYINTQYQDGNTGIQATMPIFTGLGNWYLAKSAAYTLQSESDHLAELRKAVTIEVTAAYLKVLFTGELLKVADAKLTSTREQLRMNEGFFDAGRMSMVDVVSVRSQVAQDNLARIQAENDVQSARLALAQLLCMDDERGLALRIPVNRNDSVIQLPPDPGKVWEYAARNHPGLLSSEMLIRSREADVAAARSRFSPSLALNGIVYTRYSELGVNPLNPTEPYPYSTQLADNMYARASVNLSVPIFSQMQNRNRLNRAVLQAGDARLQLEQKKQTIRQDIQTAWTAAVNARSRYEASADAVESATQSWNLSREKYNAGISSTVDFKIAQNQLIQAQVTRIQARYDWLIRSAILDLYLDKPLSIN